MDDKTKYGPNIFPNSIPKVFPTPPGPKEMPNDDLISARAEIASLKSEIERLKHVKDFHLQQIKELRPYRDLYNEAKLAFEMHSKPHAHLIRRIQLLEQDRDLQMEKFELAVKRIMDTLAPFKKY